MQPMEAAEQRLPLHRMTLWGHPSYRLQVHFRLLRVHEIVPSSGYVLAEIYGGDEKGTLSWVLTLESESSLRF